MQPRKLPAWIIHLGRFAGRPWYPVLLAFLSAIDLFVLFIPAEGIMVASTMALPRRWFLLAVGSTVGSTLGSVGLAIVLLTHGQASLEWLSPGITDTSTWQFTDRWMDQYGIWALLALSATPMILVPAVALAALAGLPAAQVGAAVLCGRLLRNCLYTYLASHAPRLLFKLKSINKEVREVVPEVGTQDAAKDIKPRAPE